MRSFYCKSLKKRILPHKISLEPQHLLIVQTILRQHLPSDVNVWVFGSRATGKIKPFSDLDLMLQQSGSNKISANIIRQLAQAFDDSILPWKVDLVDYYDLSTEFRSVIDQQKIAFPLN